MLVIACIYNTTIVGATLRIISPLTSTDKKLKSFFFV